MTRKNEKKARTLIVNVWSLQTKIVETFFTFERGEVLIIFPYLSQIVEENFKTRYSIKKL